MKCQTESRAVYFTSPLIPDRSDWAISKQTPWCSVLRLVLLSNLHVLKVGTIGSVVPVSASPPQHTWEDYRFPCTNKSTQTILDCEGASKVGCVYLHLNVSIAVNAGLSDTDADGSNCYQAPQSSSHPFTFSWLIRTLFCALKPQPCVSFQVDWFLPAV